MRFLFTAILIAVAAFSTSASAVVPTVEKPIAVLRALDKITARVEELDVPIGHPYSFGTLIVTVRACRVTLPEDTPEAVAFLEISELKPGASDAPIFRGWMFASSPALSALEHPIYDIWVTGCKDSEASATEKSAAPATTPTQPAAPTALPAIPPAQSKSPAKAAH